MVTVTIPTVLQRHLRSPAVEEINILNIHASANHPRVMRISQKSDYSYMGYAEWYSVEFHTYQTLEDVMKGTWSIEERNNTSVKRSI